jgi:hypothetical protein
MLNELARKYEKEIVDTLVRLMREDEHPLGAIKLLLDIGWTDSFILPPAANEQELSSEAFEAAYQELMEAMRKAGGA